MAGTNYKAKCKTDTGKSLEVVVFRPLPHTNTAPSVSSVKECW